MATEQLSRDELILKYAVTREPPSEQHPAGREPLVTRIAKKAYRKEREGGARFMDLEDIKQELTVSLIQLIDKYQPDKCDSIEAYLAQHLAWRVHDAVEESRVDRDRAEPLVDDSGREAIPECETGGWRRSTTNGKRVPMPQAESKASPGVTMMKARICMEGLSQRDQEIITTAIFGDLSQQQTAEMFGVSQPTVSRLVKKFCGTVHRRRVAQ